MPDALIADLYRLRGEFDAVKERLDKIDDVLERIDTRLARIEARENERKGAFRLAVFLAGVIGAASVKLVAFLAQFIK